MTQTNTQNVLSPVSFTLRLEKSSIQNKLNYDQSSTNIYLPDFPQKFTLL